MDCLALPDCNGSQAAQTFISTAERFNPPATLLTSVPITLGGPATIDSNGNSITIASSLSGSGGLTKINNGTLTLESVNVYSGGTTVAGGLLAVTVGASLGSGPVNVSAWNIGCHAKPANRRFD